MKSITIDEIIAQMPSDFMADHDFGSTAKTPSHGCTLTKRAITQDKWRCDRV